VPEFLAFGVLFLTVHLPEIDHFSAVLLQTTAIMGLAAAKEISAPDPMLWSGLPGISKRIFRRGEIHREC
jgi:hypothetical protein